MIGSKKNNNNTNLFGIQKGITLKYFEFLKHVERKRVMFRLADNISLPISLPHLRFRLKFVTYKVYQTHLNS